MKPVTKRRSKTGEEQNKDKDIKDKDINGENRENDKQPATEQVIGNPIQIPHPPTEESNLTQSNEPTENEPLKKTPLLLKNNPNFQLEKSKRFTPYSFIKPNKRKRLLSPSADDSSDEWEELNERYKKLRGDNDSPPLMKDGEIHDVKDGVENGEDGRKDGGEVKDGGKDEEELKDNHPPEDQWIHGINSKISDRKVQFKRKRDSVAYRIAPEDVKNSLIKPGDFNFLTPKESEKYSWKFPDKIQQKRFKKHLDNNLRKESNKRFRLY